MLTAFRNWIGRLPTLPRPKSASRRGSAKPTDGYRPRLETLEDRTAPAVFDMTPHDPPSVETINDAIFSHFHGVSGGGGGADKFLSLDSSHSIEQGYNTEAALELDAKEPTRVFRLSRFPTVNIGGVLYREITLDVNESGQSHQYIALNDLRVYAHNTTTLTGYSASPLFQLGGQSPVYDLDELEDNTILLDGQGGGALDMFVLIPDSAFDAARAAFGPDPYVYLYSRFGDTAGLTSSNIPPGSLPSDFAADDGDETWSANPNSLYPTADVRVTKTDGAATAIPGTTVTYTITVTNSGPNTVTSLNFTDVLPTDPVLGQLLLGMSFGPPSEGTLTVSLTGNTYSGTWTGLSLAPGESATVTLTGTVNPLATAAMTLTNTVSAFPTDFADPTPGNNTATDTDTLTPRVDLDVDKDDISATEVPGTPVTYTIRMTNAGPSTVTAVRLTDTSTPTLIGLQYDNLPAGATYDPGTGVLGGITLAAGGSISFQVTGLIPPGATGTLENTITVTPIGATDTDTGNNTDNDVDTLTPVADLRITKSDAVDTVYPGQALAYFITVENLGPSDVVGAHVVDVFPSEISSHAWFVLTASTGASSSPSTGGVAADLDTFVTIPSGGVIVFQVNRIIDPALTPPAGGQLLSNTAIVAPPDGTTDPVPGNNSSTHDDTILPNPDVFADLRVEKSHTPEPAVPGGTVTYTITVTNDGPDAVAGGTVTDAFLGSPGFAAFTSMTWTATAELGGADSLGDSGTGPLSDTFNMPFGGSITYTITAVVAPTARGQIVNVVQTQTPPGVIDNHSPDNTATDTVNLTPQADLAVTKTDGRATATPGDPITYTITVTNNGPSTVASLFLTDMVPASIVLDPAQPFIPSVGTYNSTTGEWTGLSLGTGQSVTLTIQGTIRPSATGTIINTAVVSPPSDTSDPTPGNNSSTDETNLVSEVDVGVTKTDGVTTAVPGRRVTYTIVVTNAGPSDATNVLVSDRFPAARFTWARWVSTATGGATGNQLSGTGRISDLINLPVGSSVTYTVRALVNPRLTGTLVNTVTATVPDGTTDVNPQDDTATDVDQLTPVADLAIVKRATTAFVAPSGLVSFQMVVTNRGPSAVTSLFLHELALPRYGFIPLSFVPSAGTYNSRTGLWSGLNLAPGQRVTMTVHGRASLPSGNLAFNMVSIDPPAGVIDPNTDNNFANASVPIGTPTKRWLLASTW